VVRDAGVAVRAILLFCGAFSERIKIRSAKEEFTLRLTYNQVVSNQASRAQKPDF
jgi:hypothetical protein